MARVQLNKATYSGGHPQRPKGGQGFVVVLDDQGVHLRRFTELFVVPWGEVTAIDVLGPDQAESRFTMTRMAAMGPLALAAKKTTSDAYVSIRTVHGCEFGATVPKTSAGRMRAKLGPWIARIPPQQPAVAGPQGPPMNMPPPVQPQPAVSVADELTKLGQLRDQGLLTNEEFQAQKTRLLGG